MARFEVGTGKKYKNYKIFEKTIDIYKFVLYNKYIVKNRINSKRRRIIDMTKMKVYVAIGHFKGTKNIICITEKTFTRKQFEKDCRRNEFVSYCIITESMMQKLLQLKSCGGMELYYQVCKMVTNYRVICDVEKYINQCSDIILEKMEIAKKEEF